jgi:nitrate reductase assembly molybdenum cofactor insertion protein NarJ
MGEKSATREARRAVKRLSERYFLELKNRLREENDAFWARTVAALLARDEQEPRSAENRDPVDRAERDGR